ncbi:hypothetical protein KR054_010105, partial [Drosophila jambulina]
RHLQMIHFEALSDVQLEKIYQEFAVPQPQRQPRMRSTAAGATLPPPPPPPPPMVAQVEQLAQRIKNTAMLDQKRPLSAEQPGSDYKVKQIKMDLD